MSWRYSTCFSTSPPFTNEETEDIASRVYDYVWQRSASGQDLAAA